MKRIVAALIFACCRSMAADLPLDSLKASLLEMRLAPIDARAPRGATEELTIAKHRLRDWVESRLEGFPQAGNELLFSQKLNIELRSAKLFCSETNCQRDYLNGYLNSLILRRSTGYLIVQTAVGIQCGFDHSAYIYNWSVSGWNRVWQNEQTNYTTVHYTPQKLHAVLISPYQEGQAPVVLTLGTHSWCSSTWHPVYYRLFRLGAELAPRPSLHGSAMAWLGKDDSAVHGRISAEDAWIEYTILSIDGGAHNRQAVQHFKITPTKIERIQPVALRPRDFVEEWLQTGWQEAAAWSDTPDLGAQHLALHKPFVGGSYIETTKHCSAALWQVGIELGVPPKPFYFVVRWEKSNHFTMMHILNQPMPECHATDPNADEERTLFPAR